MDQLSASTALRVTGPLLRKHGLTRALPEATSLNKVLADAAKLILISDAKRVPMLACEKATKELRGKSWEVAA